MSERTIDTELPGYFHSLPKPQQLDVLSYLKSLIKKGSRPQKDLLKLAGSISPKDLKLMRYTFPM